MKNRLLFLMVFYLLVNNLIWSQHISDFVSLGPATQDTDFHIPSTHSFQYLIEEGDLLSDSNSLPGNCDFTGYIPIQSSSKFGYLSINSESNPGAVTILDIELDINNGEWIINKSKAVDFSPGTVDFSNSNTGTLKNCSGTVTPWNTIITCEESTSFDTNNDGYYDYGWAIEIDPRTKTVINQNGGKDKADKLWALGNFKHENVVIHSNRKTLYQGADDTNGEGYLFKFVADQAEDLSSGDLFVYNGDKQENGQWIQINNDTKDEQNSTLAQCATIGATNFGGIEDVEINPIDGMIYFAVKRENVGDGKKRGVVYRFSDSNILNGTGDVNMEIYAGGDIKYNEESWGNGTDNLVFDNLGNLWVAQDESGSNRRNYIWLIENGHTQQDPKVKIFSQTPIGSEPTGLTFSPDYKYLFMSIQHPSSNNDATNQLDAFGFPRLFDKDVTLVIARKENLNNNLNQVSDDIMISQYYHDTASNSKWIEIKNRSNTTIEEGNYFLTRYKDSGSNLIAWQAIPKLLPDEVLLFKNQGASKPAPSNLGLANKIETDVCNFEGDDLIAISSTAGAISYNNRRDIIGEIPISDWGSNKSFIRATNQEIPEINFEMSNWMEISTGLEVDIALINTNIALGTQDMGPSIWNGYTWNKNTIPDRTRNVEIYNSYKASDGSLIANNLSVEPGSVINFVGNPSSTNSIIVHGDLSIKGDLYIGDQESLVMYDDNANISGIIYKQERSTYRNNDKDITYWSSPTSDETIENVFAGVDPNRIFYHDQNLSSATDDSDPTYYDVWQPASGNMIPAQGYAAEGVIGATGYHNLIFTGTPNNGKIIYTVKGFTNDDLDNDYNLIGNPYPSAININSFFDKNSSVVDEIIYLWTHSTINGDSGSNDFVSSDYATYNRMGGTASSNGGAKPLDTLGSGQGFFVRAKYSGDIIFNNSMRRAYQNIPFFKNAYTKGSTAINNSKKDRIWLNLTTDQGGFNQLLIGFLEEATDHIDAGYDALKLEGGNTIGFFSLIDDSKFTIQGLGAFTQNVKVSLGFETNVSPRWLTIGIDKIEGVLNESEIYLLDNELNVIHDLKKADYNFEQLEKGEFLNRFSLQFENIALSTDDLQTDRNFTILHAEDGLIIEGQNIVSKVRVYDLLGRVLVETNPNNQRFKIQTTTIKSGTVIIIQLTLINHFVSSKMTIRD